MVRVDQEKQTHQCTSKDVAYDIIEASNDQIISVSELTDDNKKIVIFDDFVCEKNQSH